ncbi:MAG TPA: hypothetical protein VIY49_12505 [Bryobacteraceae bacterium]
MERRALGVLALILIGLMALVATAGLDGLPRSLKKSVEAENGVVSHDQEALQLDRTRIEAAIAEDPALFAKEADPWRARLDQDKATFADAGGKLVALQQLAKANRRGDEYSVERGLKDINSLLDEALRDASAVDAEAQRRLAFKKALPQRLEAMRSSYQTLESIATDSNESSIRKAMSDWPAKSQDLQMRLDAVDKLEKQGRQVWDSSAQLRDSAAKNNLVDTDIETLSTDADQLDSLRQQARDALVSDSALAGQLYVGWDKLLVEVERGQEPREKVRIVRTRFPDSTLAHGETTSEERWEPLAASLARRSEDPDGMVIERKPAGRYDSEADDTLQPPAYAYIAPPGQSNAYGSWSGGIWHWLPEYLLLSQLLHSSREPIYLPDYDAYRYARSRGETYYGRNREYAPPERPSGRGPSSNGWYSERPRSSSPGGFSSSPYRSRGTFSSSPYRSRGTFGSSGFGSSGGFRSYSRGRR